MRKHFTAIDQESNGEIETRTKSQTSVQNESHTPHDRIQSKLDALDVHFEQLETDLHDANQGSRTRAKPRNSMRPLAIGQQNESCFSIPSAFTYGNESRTDNTLRQPGVANWICRCSRTFESKNVPRLTSVSKPSTSSTGYGLGARTPGLAISHSAGLCRNPPETPADFGPGHVLMSCLRLRSLPLLSATAFLLFLEEWIVYKL